MVSIVATAVIAIVVVGIVAKARSWRRAYTIAKSSQFPVFASPVHLTDVWWLMLYPLLVPQLNKLPKSWTTPWLSMAQLWSIWKIGYTPFQDVGADTFMLATPNGNLLWSADPKVIHQLELQHPKSQVAVDMMSFYEIYGPTIGTVEGPEGAEWKRHRKVIMSAFTPSTNSAVWSVTTRQTRALVDCWLHQGGKVQVMKDWTCRLALHVISAVFFNKNITWDSYTGHAEAIPDGHKLSYQDSLFTVLARLGTLYITPPAIRGAIPFGRVQEVNLAFNEWTQYMQELQGDAFARIDEISTKKNRTILESMVLAGTIGSSQTGDRPLPKQTILGNMFFMLLAGHETSGNTMAFVFLLLAIYPEYQVKIQEELDAHSRERKPEAWTVEGEYALFQKGWIGAVLHEVMRLYAVIQFIPRMIVDPVTLVDSKGETHVVPERTLCCLNLPAAFMRPDTWNQPDVPASRRAELHQTHALDFDPTRWLKGDGVTTATMGEDGGVPLLFPFGQGPHACPGRMFAMVEMTAMIATLFREFSLELVVPEATKQKFGGDSAKAWEATRDDAMRMMYDSIDANITIQLSEALPIRVFERKA